MLCTPDGSLPKEEEGEVASFLDHCLEETPFDLKNDSKEQQLLTKTTGSHFFNAGEKDVQFNCLPTEIVEELKFFLSKN
ncbi:MAG: hypothetical protein HON90_03475, partial [Halobacteriovoraceae bacterium]|nr:hypothetical protein [Halobacteriovoraceae bacterium]